jgi:phage virion morphogenesis protein
MTGLALQIRLDDSALTRALAAAAETATDTRPLMQQVGAAVLTSTQMRFEREAGPNGNPWPPSLRARLGGGKTLRDSNRLYQSLTFNAQADQVEVGTNAIYAAIHQTGGTIRAKNKKALKFKVGGAWISKESVTIPPRPFLGIDDDDRAEIEAIAGDWLEGLFQ